MIPCTLRIAIRYADCRANALQTMRARCAHPEALNTTQGSLSRVLIANVTTGHLHHALLSTHFSVTQYCADVLHFYHS